ncbi:MAG: hypothetical protein KatS3mg057_1365 [Herpetosiphonaceae bacterium]|nr:MAG: hypothetical protein KatS3mg057_1365 [Herpetosiphonaceae bacterium]
MIDRMDKTTLLRLIQEEYGRFNALLAELSEEEMIAPGVEDDWSVKDILVHLTNWQTYMITRVRTALRGERPERRPDADMDRINTAIYASHREQPLHEVRLAFHHSYQVVIETLETLNDEDLAPGSRFRELMGEPALGHIAGNTFEHYREHGANIRAWLDKRRDTQI